MTAAVETRPFWDLSRRDVGTALVADGEEIGYDDLADRVARLAARLGGTRRLVLLEAANDVDTVVGYLACLVGHHPVLVTAPGSALLDTYDPDVVLSGGELVEHRGGTRHDLHPDLAVLLSTSGSTGSPKLVRLSRDAVAANARGIAETLGIRSSDVAATTLPLHYCYGLSVLTSHLEAGAAVLVTSASVVDPVLWDEVRRHRVSTFPGVPHTFDLLDRAGFAGLDLPSLRYLTCAGGRLPAATATRYAELGVRRGFDLFLMYGATEATARMAVLSPDRVRATPTLLGEPVPGGSFEVRPLGAGDAGDADGAAGNVASGHEADEVGELVFHGDNVMLGYAESPADLARGREVAELRTGDLVRRTPDGLEVVGRLGRFAKVFGLRIDLERVEAGLRAAGVVGYAADAGSRVAVGVDRSARPLTPADHARVLDAVEAAGLPRTGCVVVELDGVPRRSNGKVDHAAVAATLTGPEASPATSSPAPGSREGSSPVTVAATTTATDPTGASVSAVAEVLASVGRGPSRPEDTFVSRGGDSLSYVETSLRLERLLGHLPVRWHLLTAAELAVSPARGTNRRAARPRKAPTTPESARAARPTDPSGRPTGAARLTSRLTSSLTSRLTGTLGAAGRTSSVETNVLLRAVAIVLIVGSHSNMFMVLGGAHVLVGLVGYNLARFHLVDRDRRERVRGMLTSIARVAVPTVLWLSFAAATSAKYDWRNVLLLNGVLGTREWSEAWHYWFVEALVWTLLAVVALLAIPAVHRLERRAPFWFPVALVVAALPTRYDLVRVLDGDYIHRAHVLFWLFALGWATAQARRPLHRVVVTALTVATVPGFFEGQPEREAVVVAGFLLLVWVPSLRVPAAVARLAGVLAGASLFIYLCHWQIYPAYEFSLPWLATGLSLAAGIAFWRANTWLAPRVEDRLADRAARPRRRADAWEEHPRPTRDGALPTHLPRWRLLRSTTWARRRRPLEIPENRRGLSLRRYLTRDEAPAPDARAVSRTG